MQIGFTPFCQNLTDGAISDGDFIKRELELCVLAEELGFDFIAWPEHHFDTYSMSPDNFMTLSYVAARTSRIKLATGVVVLPWNDPLRVAEKLILLDEMSDGRVIFGMGRGLAPLEYNAFGIDMNEARARFDEAAGMIVRALETGVMEGDGPHYPQAAVKLRPEPSRSFEGRIYCVANTPNSAGATARLGTSMLFFARNRIEEHMPLITAYREAFETAHPGREALGPMIADLTYCHAETEVPQDVSEAWLRAEIATNNHYELATADFANITGYEAYAKRQATLNDRTPQEAAQAVWDVQANGSPERIIDTWRHRAELIGGRPGAVFVFDWGGLDRSRVEGSMRLFAAEALPELQKIGESAVVA
jgi:alkanesulfonate monooxygenase SsuD/methylene tetrahydromethanopterin reductase-like flavin-dependent oxidoreductase (luciferase family)